MEMTFLNAFVLFEQKTTTALQQLKQLLKFTWQSFNAAWQFYILITEIIPTIHNMHHNI